MLDTYLSSEEYTGTELRLVARSETMLKKHPRWQRLTTHQGNLQTAEPRSHDNNTLAALYSFSYGMRHAWQTKTSCGLTFYAGAQAELGIGFNYNTRNGNNPAQARAYLNLGPSVGAKLLFGNPLALLFHKFQNARKWTLRYDAYAPLLGAMFSPNYGQSYYEIFSCGNYDHNIVFTTPFCAPSVRHQVVVDVPMRKGAFRFGYLGDCQQAEVNNLKYHTYSHLLLLGYVRYL